MAATTSGYEAIRSGDTILFYVNRDGLPLSDRCNERMWSFCMEQYPKSKTKRCFLCLSQFFFKSKRQVWIKRRRKKETKELLCVVLIKHDTTQ